ncbi:MAG: hypothetical protein KKE39_05905 [Bacteroidetes bacterium]|nr:hypothetical protein [Bacteroidota bacterium]MBU1371383.1 hypothetical protein [Bacteroidota bacterium]MBU1485871.1 hypothetical protein [Bacteroidota bacterium]MBU1761458.1 hypothetical protein [Bacteroidota bacterium]MBU2267167.1 hypothetical protein [Bacteroidota bacterium]
MENSNLLTLAEISFEGKNYQDAYEKYSKVIESNINDQRAWIGKGISVGYLSNSSKSTLDEVKVSLNHALKLSINDSEKKFILENLIPIAEYNVRLLISKARGIVDEKAKEPLSTFQLQATRSVQQTADRYKANNEIFDPVFSTIKFTELGNSFGADEDYTKNQIKLIDSFLNAINSEIHEEKKRELLGFRSEIISNISKVDGSYSAPEPPKGGGCFIATEIYQNDSHPKVIVLRNYRDTVLHNSKAGREFISLYYKHSPLIAKKLSDKRLIKTLIKKIILEPLILLIKK